MAYNSPKFSQNEGAGGDNVENGSGSGSDMTQVNYWQTAFGVKFAHLALPSQIRGNLHLICTMVYNSPIFAQNDSVGWVLLGNGSGLGFDIALFDYRQTPFEVKWAPRTLSSQIRGNLH